MELFIGLFVIGLLYSVFGKRDTATERLERAEGTERHRGWLRDIRKEGYEQGMRDAKGGE